MLETEEDLRRRELVRRITTFRRSGDRHRRSEERHRLRLYEPAALAGALRRSGFRVRALRGCGKSAFPAGLAGFLAVRR